MTIKTETKCKFGWHTYGKWKEVGSGYLELTFLPGHIVGQYKEQEKSCIHCDKSKMRTVKTQ